MEWLEKKIGWMYVANRRKMIWKGVVRRRSRMVVCNMQGKNIEKVLVRRRNWIIVCNR
jgi:hypothetical protein